MMRGWEDRCGVPRQTALDISLAWVEGCDALLVLGMSSGVRLEMEHAKSIGLPVCFDIDDFPDVNARAA
jgi:sugar/nucleoside kinase (ribokinase family)